MTNALQVGVIPDGEYGTVHMEDRFDTGIADLWSAITDPERVARWIAVVTGDFKVGGEVQAHFTSNWEGAMRIEVCDAPHRLVLSGAGEETSVIEAVLTEDGGGTRLVIEDRGLPAADAPYHAAGWQVHIEDLTAYLAGKPTSNWEPRWRELFSEYGIPVS
ncbi:MAG TPA: SRPBCC family protein [Pseudolysinimonas sp.]